MSPLSFAARQSPCESTNNKNWRQFNNKKYYQNKFHWYSYLPCTYVTVDSPIAEIDFVMFKCLNNAGRKHKSSKVSLTSDIGVFSYSSPLKINCSQRSITPVWYRIHVSTKTEPISYLNNLITKSWWNQIINKIYEEMITYRFSIH